MAEKLGLMEKIITNGIVNMVVLRCGIKNKKIIWVSLTL